MSQDPTIYTLGILASGGGSNFRAIAEAISDGRLAQARIGVVVSDQPQAGVLQLAEERRIPNTYLGDVTSAERNQKIATLFAEHQVDLVIAAGYLRLIGEPLLSMFPDRILNIHPAPLPRFGGKGMYGHHVHQAVLDAGVTTSGPTIHLVNAVYDDGKILAHTPVPIRPDDTADSLAVRVLAAEHDLYWRVIAQQLKLLNS